MQSSNFKFMIAILGSLIAAYGLQSCTAIEKAAATSQQQEKLPITEDRSDHHASSKKTNYLTCEEKEDAPRLMNLGNHTFPVSTQNQQAQLYINQGLNLSYGFNHEEAGRAFREAARLDPELAMAYWGQALVLGPNINADMEKDHELQAQQLIQQAKQLMQHASPRELALIEALEKRYSGHAQQRKTNDKAYAQAMREVHQLFPDDQDIATLYVESVMDLSPWGYWMPDGTPHEGIAEVVALTEKVLQDNPLHPGALHMYIHLMESTKTPEKAEQAADTLLHLVPEAGHLVHMTAHIYQNVGRYADSIKSNQMAIAVDENYISQCHEKGHYPVLYYPHNIHFLWYAATADGQSKLAIESARKAANMIDEKTLQEIPLTAIFRVAPYWALVRFGLWQEILAEPAPQTDNLFIHGSWHYIRGLALVATDQIQQAEQELEELRKNTQALIADDIVISKNNASSILNIAVEVLTGEIAFARAQFDQAILHLDKAVRLEDALQYTEPAEFQFPPRLALGAMLLTIGRAEEAETVYWEDLKHNRDNGWALFGLMQALTAQNKHERAAIIKTRFAKAWQRADIKLTRSRFGR